MSHSFISESFSARPEEKTNKQKKNTAFAQAGEQSSAAVVGKRQRDEGWQDESRLCEASPDFTTTVASPLTQASHAAGPKGLLPDGIGLRHLCCFR